MHDEERVIHSCEGRGRCVCRCVCVCAYVCISAAAPVSKEERDWSAAAERGNRPSTLNTEKKGAKVQCTHSLSRTPPRQATTTTPKEETSKKYASLRQATIAESGCGCGGIASYVPLAVGGRRHRFRLGHVPSSPVYGTCPRNSKQACAHNKLKAAQYKSSSMPICPPHLPVSSLSSPQTTKR